MLILTTESVPGKKIKEVVGLVKGSTIRAKHIGKDIGAGFKQLVGGELTGYDEMLTEARKIAIGRMVDDAKSQGANAKKKRGQTFCRFHLEIRKFSAFSQQIATFSV